MDRPQRVRASGPGPRCADANPHRCSHASPQQLGLRRQQGRPHGRQPARTDSARGAEYHQYREGGRDRGGEPAVWRCHLRPRRHTARLHAPDAADVPLLVLRGLGLAAWGLRLRPESSGLAAMPGRPRWAALVLYAETVVKYLLLACVAGLSIAHVLAQAPSPKHQAPALGRIVFPNSGSAAAQADFLRGVAWLHSFMYEDAIDAFRAAQKIDPSFALAYWGEAMSFSQPLWFFEEVPQARAALAKLGPSPQARIAKAKTPREQGFMRAVEALFGPGDRPARHAEYAAVMSKLAADHPADDEAQAFHALALLGTLPRGDAALPIRQRAGAIAETVFTRNPKHPGAAHYILHAYDHGTLAGKALPAARAYAKLAPAASHALHMPAHAFLQVGFWDEAAASDEASWNASIAWAKRRGLSIASRDYHSLTWLQYEWTQQGRFSKTREAIAYVDQALRSPSPKPQATSPLHSGGHGYGESEIGRGSGEAALRNDRGSMRARYIIESE